MADLGDPSWSEIDASNNAVPPSGWPEGMAPSDVNNSARAQMGGEKRWWDRSNSTQTTTGTSTAYVLTYTAPESALYDGEETSFVLHVTCGANPTLNRDGLGAKFLRRFDYVTNAFIAVVAGEFRINQVLRVRYNLAADRFDIISSSLSARTSFSVAAQVFTSSGTYTPATGMSYCIIECVGGGGGGGGVGVSASSTIAAGGGGAGGYSSAVKTAADIGASKAVAIGAAGAAGATGDNTGGNGGDTSVGALVIAKGGSGGEGAGAAIGGLGGLGGIAGTGDVAATGEPGSAGGGGIAVGVGTGVPVGGAGGSGRYGGGARSVVQNTGNSVTAGNAGTGKGSGGGGATNATAGGATTAAGGAGSAGYVVITEYVYA